MTHIRFPVAVAAMLSLATVASARDPDRRPCVAPDTPAGCASLPRMAAPPGGPPSPDRQKVKTMAIPLEKTPEAEPARPAEGTVIVGGQTPAPPTSSPPPGTVGPPKSE